MNLTVATNSLQCQNGSCRKGVSVKLSGPYVACKFKKILLRYISTLKGTFLTPKEYYYV